MKKANVESGDETLQYCPKFEFEEVWDVVIVGSGFAGMAAAIEAGKAGARTLVLEKMPTPGGNSIIDEGMLSVVLSPQQKKRHIRDSSSLLADDMLQNGEFLNDREKVMFIADESSRLYQWTVDELGIEWLPVVTWAGGHSVPRTLTVKSGSGREIYQKCRNRVEKLGIEVRCCTYVETVDRNDEGVSGVIVREGYNFPDATSGTLKYVRALRGLVLAYGGFSADPDYRARYDETLRRYDTTNHPGATGELWRETERIGCMQTEVGRIQCTPWSNPREKGMGRAWLFADYVGADAGLWVNTQGVRFVNELGNRKSSAEAVLDQHRAGFRALAIGNVLSKSRLDKIRPGYMDEMLSLGLIDCYESIQDIETAWHIPVGSLSATVKLYNDFVRSKKDPDYFRPIQCKEVLIDGPWYVAEMMPKVHHSMGGLCTNRDAQCVDALTAQVIPNLFAAGECAGGVHGACRMGSCAILDCFVMGRVAGANAAAGGVLKSDGCRRVSY